MTELEKTISRIDQKKTDWKIKKEAAVKELSGLDSKLKRLEIKRNSFILAAKGEGNKEAEGKLDKASKDLLEEQQSKAILEVYVNQIDEKINELETQKSDYERQSKIFELNKLRDKRSEMNQEIDKCMDKLLPILLAYKNLGREMYQKAKDLGAGHASIYTENKLANYLHGKLGKVLPSDFQGTLSRRIENLTKVDLEGVDAILEARNLTVKSKQKETA